MCWGLFKKSKLLTYLKTEKNEHIKSKIGKTECIKNVEDL